MPQAKLMFRKYGYIPDNCDSYGLYALAIFLSTEINDSFDYNFFYNWMKDPTLDVTGGDLSGLEKNGSNVVITLDFDEELYEKDPEKYSLTISLDQLISVTEQWNTILKQKPIPPFIIITEDNGIYTLSASQE